MTTVDIWQEGDRGAPPPPLVKGAPLVGSAFAMLNDPLPFLVEAYQSYGPVFQVKALNRQFTVLAGPDANLFMSRDGDTYLTGKDAWDTFADEINSNYFLASLDGEPHSRTLQRSSSL